ncbi:MAG: CDP-alcohol phosphatidyltransferase family protein [Deltaproteobacteria bacterium]|nr:CDP-alcohol phosphatidyltransferase family protein [Deltaproteobacteria bacterium]
MLDLKATRHVSPLLDSVGRWLGGVGVSPVAVSALGLAVTGVGALLVGAGELLIGALVVGAGCALDALDGAVARASARASARGAIVDSLFDRLGETFMWTGLAYYVAGRPALVALCMLCLGLSFMISYLRSKAEIAGIEGRGGWMARPERVILYVLGAGSGFIELMLWFMMFLTALTVVQRWRQVWLRLPQRP